MSELFEDETPAGNAPEFTVSEISGAIKRVIEGEFAHVRVRGEVGRVSRPRSGHVYLDLKDDRNVLSGVIWKGVAARLTTQPEEGLEVIATGRLTTFGGQSKYQIVIEDIQPAGQGALMAMLEKRKKALEAEGLFAAERKRPLPFLPEVIGVVTSPSGAVIRDILHRLRDRFPRKVLIWPVAVQGAKCAPEVAAAIEGFNRMTPGGALPRPDLIIVARGGGSLEDLWGFNEEIVARAAAASEIPLISAVGHETDTTLIDYVADMRAPTPTAAAELAVPVRHELLAWTDQMQARLARGVSQALTQRGQRLRDLSRALPRPETLVGQARQRLDHASERLPAALQARVQRGHVRLGQAAGALRPAALATLIRTRRRDADGLAARLAPALLRGVRDRKQALQRVVPRPPRRVLLAEQERFARTVRQLAEAARRAERARADRLAALDRLRETLGYTATLKRGYAVVRAEGRVVTDKAAAEAHQLLEIEFQDGRIDVARGGARPKARTKGPAAPPEQEELF